jgi:hypothetical protein
MEGTFALESGDAERIAVNHVATTSDISGGSSSSGAVRGPSPSCVYRTAPHAD